MEAILNAWNSIMNLPERIPFLVYVYLIVGFVLLIKGADFFVDGASAVAKLLRVPSVVIGLTIVALGTSAPEAAVSITAGLSGSNEIAISNVIGSNIFNLLMVIGICAAIQAFATDMEILKRDMPVNIATTLVLLLFLLNGEISRVEGILLLVGLVVYLAVVVRSALVNRKKQEAVQSEDTPQEKKLTIPVIILFIVGGMLAIVWGGDLVVDNAQRIALSFGMSPMLVGLTIVALGTSLPELVTSIVASRKGESGLALGNAVGSCLFNILFILGISSVLSPIVPTGESVIESITDTGILAGISVLMLIFSATGKKVSRAEGIIYVCLYGAYMAFAILRCYVF
ncbi:MAG: calcium/sodium antiporter [Bacteroides sp.]|nr:calcium/sodium antiporter [Bacteroides sp.]MCM1549460.1 calcium/sodium antiporter [Clostridium sp.]